MATLSLEDATRSCDINKMKRLTNSTPRSVTCLTDIIKRLEQRVEDQTTLNFYRGHGTVGHILAPSLFRSPHTSSHEKNFLREIVSIHPSEFSSDKGVFEQLVRMAHYSLPTRLLDITTNPLVALYFCCTNQKEADGELIRFIAETRQVKYYDSDTVSCVANLANLTSTEKIRLRAIVSDDKLKNSTVGSRLLQFIKAEKPYFNPEIVRNHLDAPLVVKPRLSNRRLLAQQGAFILLGLEGTLADDNDYGIKIQRVTITSTAKAKIIKSLDKVGINDSTMFPDLESAARYIMQKVTPAIDMTFE